MDLHDRGYDHRGAVAWMPISDKLCGDPFCCVLSVKCCKQHRFSLLGDREITIFVAEMAICGRCCGASNCTALVQVDAIQIQAQPSRDSFQAETMSRAHAWRCDWPEADPTDWKADQDEVRRVRSLVSCIGAQC